MADPLPHVGDGLPPSAACIGVPFAGETSWPDHWRVALNNLHVVLVSARNPLNIGAAARAMSNMGFRSLRLVNAYDVAYREARSAVGARGVVESAALHGSVAEAVADCTLVVGTTCLAHRELKHPLRRLEYGGRLIRKHLLSGAAALLFGSEKYGLTKDDMSHCHWLMRIPARPEHASMNLGQAVAVCLYELVRDEKAAATRPKPARVAKAEDLERLTGLLFQALESSGYVNPRTSSSTANKLRRMVRRMDLSARDAEIWLGMLRQILWKLGSQQ